MNRQRKSFGVIAAVALVAAAVVGSVTGAAQAQVAVGVEFHNDHGASVSCSLPQAPSTIGSTNTKTNAYCTISGHASGDAAGPLGERNFCVEGVSIDTTPRLDVGLFDCSVSVEVESMPAVTTATRTSATNVAYTCSGAWIGTATYYPAPGSPADPMTGLVTVTYESPQFDVAGALYNLESATAGNIEAVGIDGCGSSGTRATAPNSFSGTIN